MKVTAMLTTGLTALALGGVALAPAAAAAPARQDCRTYSSTTACGTLQLDQKQRDCVTRSVAAGLTERRADVECHAFA